MGPSAGSAPPPGLRQASLLEVLPALDTAEQVRSVPTMNTDTIAGYSAMRFQSAIIAFAECEATKWVLVRVDGRASKGHEDSTHSLTQRAKVGFCPRCVVPTRIAAPATFIGG